MTETADTGLPNALTNPDAAANFRNWALAFPTPDTAGFERTGVGRLFDLVMIIAGVGGIVGGLVAYYLVRQGVDEMPERGELERLLPLLAPILPCLSGAVISLIGLFRLAGRRGSRISFDRGRDMIIATGKTAGTILPGCLSFRDVACLQVCSGMIRSRDSSYRTYEINLILANPPGDRIHLVSHADRVPLKADAAKLAEFLAVPLVDDSPTVI